VTSSGERILVIGGTRGTGFQIVQRLLRDGYSVRVLARNAARARETLDPAVEIVEGDITNPESLAAAMTNVDHIIFTAGVTQRPAPEPLVKATNYDGLKNTLAAARDAGFNGRFLYMTTIGVTKPSLGATLLDLMIRNTTRWRKLAEDEIRRSGLDYTVIRAGLLTNSPGGQRAIAVGQEEYPLAFKYRISRADVAEVFVQALKHPSTRRTTFDLVGSGEAHRKDWESLFRPLRPDP
jgi:uncharacterized protein YbjT (DUF2867 family)